MASGKHVVRYETVTARAAGLASVFPRHKAYLEAFEPPSDLLGIGTFEDPTPGAPFRRLTARLASMLEPRTEVISN